MSAIQVAIGSRVRILRSRNPDRIGKLATIIGTRRAGRSAVTGMPNYVHPVNIDGVGCFLNGKPLAVEDGTFEVIYGKYEQLEDAMSAAFSLKLFSTGDADGPVGVDGIARLDDE